MPRCRRKITAPTMILPAAATFVLSVVCLGSPSTEALIGEQLLRPAASHYEYDISATGRRRIAPPFLFTVDPSGNNDLEYHVETEEDDDGDDKDFPNMGFSGDYAQESLLQIYARDKKWLEKATDDMTDEEQYPLGSLTQDDIDTITGLMVAWVRRRSISAGLAVEKLLVRVVADMRANNPVAQTTSRMYSLVSFVTT